MRKIKSVSVSEDFNWLSERHGLGSPPGIKILNPIFLKAFPEAKEAHSSREVRGVYSNKN